MRVFKYYFLFMLALVAAIVFSLAPVNQASAGDQECSDCVYNCYVRYWNSAEDAELCVTGQGGCHTGNTSVCTDLEYERNGTQERKDAGRAEGQRINDEAVYNDYLAAVGIPRQPQKVNSSSPACSACLSTQNVTGTKPYSARNQCVSMGACSFLAGQFDPVPTKPSTGPVPNPPPVPVVAEEDGGNNCGGGAFCGTDVLAFKDDILTYSAPVFGGLAMLKIIYGGILYATAGGNPQRITNAKSHISYALIGLILILGMNIILVLMGATPY